LAVATLAAVFIAKLAVWCIAIGSGSSGSSLAPLLLVGASAGALVGTAVSHVVPGAAVSPGAFAAESRGHPDHAGYLEGENHGRELGPGCRDYNIILPLMFATVIAHLVARSLHPETLMTEKLTRRGIRVSQRYEVDRQRITPVSDVMGPAADTVDEHMTVGDLTASMRAGGRHVVVVVDDAGKVVGIVTEGDIVRHPDHDAGTAASIASGDVVSVTPTTTVFAASQRLLHEGVRQLPVIEDGQLRGMFSRLDSLRVNELEANEEQEQPGWRWSTRWLSVLWRHRGDPDPTADGRGRSKASPSAPPGAEIADEQV